MKCEKCVKQGFLRNDLEKKISEGKKPTSEEIGSLSVSDFVELLVGSGPFGRFRMGNSFFELFLTKTNNLKLIIQLATSALDIAAKSVQKINE